MISFRSMQEPELDKIGDIDRSEVIRVGYEARSGDLVRMEVEWDTPNFLRDGEGEHSLAAQIAFCKTQMARGGIAIGAFDGEALAAIGILTPNIRPAMSQLSFLHVSSPYRRKGIASAITRQLIERAREQGSSRIYVSAIPSGSAVGFYRSLGFELTDDPLPELFALEPEDIHMVLELGKENAAALA